MVGDLSVGELGTHLLSQSRSPAGHSCFLSVDYISVTWFYLTAKDAGNEVEVCAGAFIYTAVIVFY